MPYTWRCWSPPEGCPTYYPNLGSACDLPADTECRYTCASIAVCSADGVWVSGCHPGDCHYIAGNLQARRKFTLMHDFLAGIGIEPERLQFSWISSAESTKFQQTAIVVIDAIKALGPNTRLIKRELKVA